MPAFDSLQRASFDGLDFPVKEVHVRGSYRYHKHEYLRVPGGVIEKLERDLYTVTMQAVFDTNIKGFGELWPTVLAAIRGKFEQGVTSALTIPTIGTIQAFMPEWDQTADMAKVRSGERVQLSFLEDQSQLFLTEALAQVQQSSLASSAENFSVTRADFEVSDADSSLFDSIQNAANSIVAIKDQTDLYGGLLSAKITQLSQLISAADTTAQSLKSPVNHELLDALHQLWQSTITLGKNLAESPQGPRTYITPKRMTVGDIASATQELGGVDDAARIMLNNAFEDPFAVPAGTTVIYFTG